MKKPKLKMPTMNAMVRLMAKKQNKKRKLNAGQEREQLVITLEALSEMPHDRFLEIAEYIEQLRFNFLLGEKNG